MTAHNDTVDSLPSSSSAGSDTGYFTESKSSTPGTTPSSTPGLAAAAPYALPPPHVPTPVSGVLPALARDFPKPAVEVDVKEALERQPGRWSIKGQMEANQRRAQQQLADDAAAKEKRAKDFEAAKRDLLASYGSFRSQS